MQTTPSSAPAGPARAAARRTRAVARIVLIVATLAAYHGIFSAPFVFDDQASIVDNASIRRLWPVSGVLSPPHAAGETVGGRPLLNLSFALNYAAGGTSVWGYHALNLAIHLGAGLLLFGLVRRTLENDSVRPRLDATATPLATAAAAMWLLHPLQTESVTYTAQRAESLAGFLVLLASWAFVRSTASPTPWRWQALSVGACALGMATKETVAVAPMLVCLYDRTFVAGRFAAAWRRRRGFYAALAATWVVLITLVIATGAGRGGTAGIGTTLSPWVYALTQCRALVRYLELAGWPGSLTFDYGTAVAHRFADIWPQALLVVALLAATIVALRRRPTVGFAGGVFLLLLAPSSSVVPIASQPMAEHRMYLPLATVAVLAGIASYFGIGRRAWLPWATVAFALGMLTWQRNQVYRSELTLWSDTVARAPANARAYSNLGNALLAAGRPAEAIACYDTALRLQSDYIDAHYNLARALVQAGRPAEAVAHYDATVRSRPEFFDAHYNFGNVLLRSGDAARATEHFEAALRLRPNDANAHVNLAAALLRLGRTAAAIGHYETAVHLAPGDVGAHLDLANALVQDGRVPEAIGHYEQALRLRPDLAPVREQLDRLRPTPAQPKK